MSILSRLTIVIQTSKQNYSLLFMVCSPAPYRLPPCLSYIFMFFPSIDVFPEIFDPSYFSLYFSFFGFSPTLIDPVSHYTYPSEENPSKKRIKQLRLQLFWLSNITYYSLSNRK